MRLFSGRHRTPTLGILLVVTLVAFEAMAVGTVMPVAVRVLHGLSLYAWGFSAFLITGLLANVIAGQWSDTRGPMAPFLFGATSFAVGLLVAGEASNMGIFVVGRRAVQGLGAGPSWSRSTSSSPRPTRTCCARGSSRRGRVPGCCRRCSGPPWAGSWPSIWAGAGSSSAWCRWWSRASCCSSRRCGAAGAPDAAPRAACGPARASRRDLVHALAAAGVVAGAALVLFAGQHPGTVALPALLGGAALLAVALPRLLPAGALRLRRGLPTAVSLRGLLPAAFYGVNAYIPLGLTSVHHFSPTAAGAALTSGSLGWAAGSWYQGRPRLAMPRGRLVRSGILLVSAGIAGSALAMLPGVTGWVAVPAWIVAGLGMGIGISSLNVSIMESSTPAEQGANSAAVQVCDTLGSSLAIGIGGAVVAAFGPHRLPWGIGVNGGLLAVLALAGVGVAVRLEGLATPTAVPG